ncbi:MAG: hypothetical protein WKG01_26245, partial [Kofleriaceae bacterium]
LILRDVHARPHHHGVMMKRAIAIAMMVPLGSMAGAAPGPGLSPPSPARPTPAPAAPTERWYGKKILIYDLILLGLTVGAVVADAGVPALIGTGALWVGAPLTHLEHHEPRKAAASFFAMRPGLFVLGAYVGWRAQGCAHTRNVFCGLKGAGYGALAGLGAATIFDATLAYELQVAPIVQPHEQTYGLGLAGSF